MFTAQTLVHAVALAALAILSPVNEYRYGKPHTNSTQIPVEMNPQRFLPFLNIDMQWLFFVLSALRDMMRFEVGNNDFVRYSLQGFDHILGVIFAGFIFPVSLMLPIYFWMPATNPLLCYYPPIMSEWVVYTFHFFFLPVSVFEMLVTDHKISERRPWNMALVMFCVSFNIAWVMHTCSVYDVLSFTLLRGLTNLTLNQKLLAYLLSSIFSFVPYFSGELVYYLWWTRRVGHEHRD